MKNNIDSIGYLVWYNVSQETITDYKAFNKLARKTKAPVKLVKEPKLVNVFRRACESIDGTQGSWRYRMIDQGFDKLYVKRDLVRSSASKTEAVASATMSKADGELTWLSYDDCVSYTEIVKFQVSDFIDTYRYSIHSLPIREAARKAIEDNLRGVLVKQGGGVYFVTESEYSGLKALAEMINSIEGAKVLMAPLVNTVEQKEMVSAALKEYLDIQVSDLVRLVEAGGSNPSAKKLNDWSKEINYLSDRLHHYSEALNMDITHSSLRNLRKKVLDLWKTT